MERKGNNCMGFLMVTSSTLINKRMWLRFTKLMASSVHFDDVRPKYYHLENVNNILNSTESSPIWFALLI